MIKLNAVTGLNVVGNTSPKEDCTACIIGKMSRLPFPKGRTRAEQVGGIVHSDLVGPFQVATPNGKLYYVIFKDDYSGYKAAYFMKNKSETEECFKEYVEKMFTEAPQCPRILRSDNGGEYTSNSFQKWLSSKGILHQTSAAHTPQQNGVSERDNRTTVEGARTELHAKNVPLYLWAAAVNYTIYTLNRTLHHDTTVTPYEIWHAKKPDVSHLRVFGTKAFAHVPDAERRKLEPKAVEGLFIGYCEQTKAYIIHIPKERKNMISRDVKFFGEKSSVTEPSDDMQIDPTNPEDTISDQPFSQPKTITEPQIRKSARGMVPKKQWPVALATPHLNTDGQNDQTDCSKPKSNTSLMQDALNILYQEPGSYKEAMASPFADKWKEGMDSEIQSLRSNNTWTLVELPPSHSAIPSRWQYKAKRDKEGKITRFKARFVAKGFKQKYGVDYHETYAPVVRYDSLRVILALTASRDLQLLQIDVQTAFLYGELDQKIYIKQPEGYVTPGHEHFVCLLHKGLYGLKQSSRLWYQKLQSSLIQLDFKQSEADPCVYTRETEGAFIILAVWVDDGLLAFDDPTAAATIIHHLQSEYKMTCSPAEHFVGLVINHDRQNRKLYLSSPQYIEKVLTKFNMIECNRIGTPSDKSTRLSTSMSPTTDISKAAMSKIPYRESVGSLMYAAITFRPDIAHSVNQLAQFCENPGEPHWKGVKRILKYLSSTRRHGLCYSGQNTNPDTIVAFSDADYAGDVDTRRSTSGFVFILNGAAVTWSSRRQNCVALSTMESEYIAASETSREAVWLRRLLDQIGIRQERPIILNCDNKSAIALAHNPEHHTRSKHIDVRLHYIREQVIKKTIEINHVSSDDQLADILTKPLEETRFAHLRASIGVLEVPHRN
jgi:hypothetical protein